MLGHYQEVQFLHKTSNLNLNLTGALAPDSSKDTVIPMATSAQNVPALLKTLGLSWGNWSIFCCILIVTIIWAVLRSQEPDH